MSESLKISLHFLPASKFIFFFLFLSSFLHSRSTPAHALDMVAWQHMVSLHARFEKYIKMDSYHHPCGEDDVYFTCCAFGL